METEVIEYICDQCENKELFYPRSIGCTRPEWYKLKKDTDFYSPHVDLNLCSKKCLLEWIKENLKDEK